MANISSANNGSNFTFRKDREKDKVTLYTKIQSLAEEQGITLTGRETLRACQIAAYLNHGLYGDRAITPDYYQKTWEFDLSWLPAYLHEYRRIDFGTEFQAALKEHQTDPKSQALKILLGIGSASLTGQGNASSQGPTSSEEWIREMPAFVMPSALAALKNELGKESNQSKKDLLNSQIAALEARLQEKENGIAVVTPEPRVPSTTPPVPTKPPTSSATPEPSSKPSPAENKPTPEANKINIVFVKGHGGTDNGAPCPHKKDLNERVSINETAEALKKLDKPNDRIDFHFHEGKVRGRYNDNTWKMRHVDNTGPTIAVHLHNNSHTNQDANGREVFYRTDNERRLAQHIYDSTATANPGAGRGIKSAPYNPKKRGANRLITHTRMYGWDSIVYEGFFLSNAQDVKEYDPLKHATGIATGIEHYVNEVYPESTA